MEAAGLAGGVVVRGGLIGVVIVVVIVSIVMVGEMGVAMIKKGVVMIVSIQVGRGVFVLAGNGPSHQFLRLLPHVGVVRRGSRAGEAAGRGDDGEVVRVVVVVVVVVMVVVEGAAERRRRRGRRRGREEVVVADDDVVIVVASVMVVVGEGSHGVEWNVDVLVTIKVLCFLINGGGGERKWRRRKLRQIQYIKRTIIFYIDHTGRRAIFASSRVESRGSKAPSSVHRENGTWEKWAKTKHFRRVVLQLLLLSAKITPN